ncbi:MAG: spermine/spermidine synthase domain-containing protein [Planctomycetota bacterium]|jgi:spermidine synthase
MPEDNAVATSIDPSADTPRLSTKTQGLNLFLVGFLVLFLELACIRWFAAYVVFLQFFTNIVLIACFLGMSCGCLAARDKRDWLGRFPILAVVTFLLAALTYLVYQNWAGLAIDVGNQASPQQVFFGTETRNPDLAQFVVPIDLIAATFFVLIALLFVGLGQLLGRAFDAYPHRVVGYTLNIGGSLLGIAAFTAVSFLQAPPVVWLLVGFAGVAYLLYQGGRLTRTRVMALAVLLVAVGILETPLRSDFQRRWSPYYAVMHAKSTGDLMVNTISHQAMVPFEESGSVYSLIHLLQQHSGGKPFRNVLIIGAGSGNDVAHALKFGDPRIDAVEIDPVIQDIGSKWHPDRPYDDPRVKAHLDDGRHFLRTTDKKYDLVVYALVDSLILHSSYANIRLESFLFTKQAFDDVKRVLRPDGTFVMYNFFRQGWVVQRAAAMTQDVFGHEPLVFSMPHRQSIGPHDSEGGFTVIVSGENRRIAEAFAENGTFWLHRVPPENLAVDGFAPSGDDRPAEQGKWERFSPARLIPAEQPPLLTSDDWPFFYLRRPMIPGLNVRSMILLGLLGLGMVWWFLPKRRAANGPPAGGKASMGGRMFFLGAAFMLLETKAVVHLALLFGSTWLVNSAVFFSVLVMILLANLYVLKVPGLKLKWHYWGLFALLAANVLIPLDVFLGGGLAWRYVTPCALVMAPIFFAGVIFARSFRDTASPDRAFGFNIAGAVVGGFSESFSMLLGFRYLLLVAMGFYLLSTYVRSVRASGPSHAEPVQVEDPDETIELEPELAGQTA